MAQSNKNSTKGINKVEQENEKVSAKEIQNKYLNEKILYTARRPFGVSYDEKSVTVTINGYNYVVAYDVPVKIPRFVAEILDSSYSENMKVYEMMKKAQQQKIIAEM